MKASKTLAAAVAAVGAATLVGGSAMAAPPPQLSDDEKATVQLYHDFNACAETKNAENQKLMKPYQEQIQKLTEEVKKRAEAVVEARSDASRDATIQAALADGMTQEQAEQMVEAMKQQELQVAFFAIAQTVTPPQRPQLVDPGQACIDELNIDVQDISSKLQSIVQKHGPGVLAPKN